MRATSRKRTVEPSPAARSTMAPNCATLASWPLTTMVADIGWPGTPGTSPSVPAETWAFCARIALLTSAGLSPNETSLAGSIQIRIARSLPNNWAWPTPRMRCTSGWMLRAM